MESWSRARSHRTEPNNGHQFADRISMRCYRTNRSLCFSNFLIMMGFYTPFILLAPLATEFKISTENANFLIAVIGFSNTAGESHG